MAYPGDLRSGYLLKVSQIIGILQAPCRTFMNPEIWRGQVGSEKHTTLKKKKNIVSEVLESGCKPFLFSKKKGRV